ncbi:MAG: hypothetical protein AMS22_10380 [Thiotrichales bacterium SG8_50]|nr:MAG: hypothetical protein AMS22_10380 [Thiotrichales bacterium SG8_50]
MRCKLGIIVSSEKDRLLVEQFLTLFDACLSRLAHRSAEIPELRGERILLAPGALVRYLGESARRLH